jgi:phosphoribosylamine--glycine ligase
MSLVQPTRILIVGDGGREHALAWKLSQEPGVNDVYVASGNDGMADLPHVGRVGPDDPVDLARRLAAELVVVGPEAPLAAGIVDDLLAAGIAAFGPTRGAARIESSKGYCREVAAAAGVPMAEGRVLQAPREARAHARRLLEAPGSLGVVIKQDGLAAGKGVAVCETVEAADSAIDAASADGSPVVVEERLAGPEASVIAICDGRDALVLPAARDHKRLLDGDEGPNTGGMGAYSPLPDLGEAGVDELVDRFHRPVLAELARRRTPFRGALYAGLILTAGGPRLLEFNARFGDPETQVILPRLAVALGPLLLAAARGNLEAARRRLGLDGSRLPAVPGATVGIVLAAPGYPAERRAGSPIEGLDAARDAGALVFHSGTRRAPEGGWETSGGRMVTVVGRGADLLSARAAADSAADLVRSPGLQRRRDIAASPPVREAVA